jgi:hypothetical protein
MSLPLVAFAWIMVGGFGIYCLVRADIQNISVDKNMIYPAGFLFLAGLLLGLEQLAVFIINMMTTVL